MISENDASTRRKASKPEVKGSSFYIVAVTYETA
jgi:hypothetical protein